MAGAVIGIAGAIAGGFAASAMGFVAGTIAYAVVSTAVSFGVQALGSALLGGDEPSSYNAPPVSTRQRGIMANVASTVQPIPVVYGSARVGGTICFLEVSGTQNEFMHIVLALSEGPISAINDIYIDDQIQSLSKFSGLVTVYKHLGAYGQTVDSDLLAAFPTAIDSSFKLSGVAYIYVKLQYNPDVFMGIPVITADVDGRTVYDPRDGTTAWSENPELCIRDYLTNSLYGCSLPDSVIDDVTIAYEADYCEELVQKLDGSGTQQRYTCNGALLTDQTRMSNIKQLQTSCNGFLVFSAGIYKAIIDKPVASTFDFTEDNIIGEWTISLGDKKRKYNVVSAEYVEPENNNQPNIALYSEAALRTEDNELILKHDISLPYVTDYNRAIRLAKIDLIRSRYAIMVEFTASFSALDLVAGDVCTITHDTPSWHDKLFRIVKLRLNPDGTVRVSAKEYNALTYEPPADGSLSTATYTLSDLNQTLVASVTTAKIYDLNVTTGKVADNAISTQTNAFTAAELNCSGTNVETIIQSAAITTEGGDVSLSTSFFNKQGSYTGSLRIYRGGTLLLDQTATRLLNGTIYGMLPVATTIIDSPAAGTYTYYIKIYTWAVGNFPVSFRSLVLTELKK